MRPAKTWWSCSWKVFRSYKPGRTDSPLIFVLLLLFLFASALNLSAALQFDVFIGYDNIVPEASWFPVVCEVKNDGLPFTGTVELTSGNQNQTRRITVELPTSTLKRFVIPMFSTTAQGYTRWDVRL